MLYSTAPVLFESTTAASVARDSINADWLAITELVGGLRFELVERRYYLALSHFRAQAQRPPLPGRTEVSAPSKSEAQRALLSLMEARKKSDKVPASQLELAIFVDPLAEVAASPLPAALRDASVPPPSCRELLGGPGRPPCDALCMMRAFLAAPLLGVDDSPAAVNRLLRSNPMFASACGFAGRGARKQAGEFTSRHLPGLSTLEEFNEVMTRYGLWHQARVGQVQENFDSGVVEMEDTLVFDTTHVIANSHCGNVVPSDQDEKPGQKAKHRKVPRIRKNCSCGESQWETCEHPWSPTDEGAAVVVKGGTRVYWAHKVSVASLGSSEVPIDVRVLQYGAEHDGKTLIAHLTLLGASFPALITMLCYVLADDAYRHNREAVSELGENAALIVPVHPNRAAMDKLTDRFWGIDHFTPTGNPVCEEGYRFEMRGRDLVNERYIWAAPDDSDGHSVCRSCPLAKQCLTKGKRRHIRVDRPDLPQIDWEHPQHLTRNRARYQMRTGVERAIKRLKIDLKAAHLPHRDALRVQAHCDKKLLTLHLLLKKARAG